MLSSSIYKFNRNLIKIFRYRNYISIKEILFGDDTLKYIKSEEYYENLTGLPKSKLINGRFISPWSKDTEKQLSDVLKYLITKKQNRLKLKSDDSLKAIKSIPVDRNRIRKSKEAHITWMGHASSYFHSDGVYILTDPAFSERASPSQYYGPKRFIPAPIHLEDLHIDIVLLSHTHYDHMDRNSVTRIGNRALWIVPLGVKKLLSEMGVTNCVELDWWQSYHFIPKNSTTTTKSTEIVFTPTKHWTSRSIYERNTCLWGSFVVISPSKKFFFAGDTAYCSVFKQIGDKYGPFDIATIPIGAYSPRSYMKDVHCDPEEALQIHLDIRSKQTAAIHWGTFPLADEEFIEPALELARVRGCKNISYKDFFTMAHGETLTVGGLPEHDLATVRSDLYGIYLESLRNTL